MYTDKFDYILAIEKEQNLTKAAKQLYISQPALTIYLNKLEDQLGVKLFDRSITPIRPTYAGERYIYYMRTIARIQNDMLDELQQIATNKMARIVLGIGSGRADFWLPYIIPEFLHGHPNVDICIREGNCQEFEKELLNQEVDLCITPLPIYSTGIAYEVLQEEVIMLAVPRNHCALEGMDVSNNSLQNLLLMPADRLNGQCFICPERGYGLNSITYSMFEKYGIRPKEIKIVNDSDVAYKLSAIGFGLVFTPICSAFPPEPETPPIYCTLDHPPFTRKIVAAYNKNIPLSPIISSFIETTKRVVNAHPSLRMP